MVEQPHVVRVEVVRGLVAENQQAAKPLQEHLWLDYWLFLLAEDTVEVNSDACISRHLVVV